MSGAGRCGRRAGRKEPEEAGRSRKKQIEADRSREKQK